MATTPKVSKLSPYAKTPRSEFFMLYYEHRKIDPDPTDKFVILEAKHTHRPDILSYEIYGDTRLWWVFMNRNLDKIVDPIYSFVPGLLLFYPTRDRLSVILSS